jgi:hypothetical protein
MEGTHAVGRQPFMPDSTLSRRSAALHARLAKYPSGNHKIIPRIPFSRAITYKLIDVGLISSVVVTWPGSRRGRRLIDGDSLDSYLDTLAAKQVLAEAKPAEVA